MLVTSTPDFWRLFVPDTAKARMPQRLTSHFAAVALLATIAVPSRAVVAADLDDARALLRAGKYEEAETFAAEQVERKIWNENWPRLLIQAQMTLGKYQDALSTYEAAMKRYPTSMTLRLMGIDVLQQCGLEEESESAKNQMLILMQSSPSRYASRDNLVAMGRYFAMQGEDARQVLELFYDRVRDSDPRHLPACIASAELALSKNDYKVAAETARQAKEIAPDDPYVHYLDARAWETTDGEKSQASLIQSLTINPKHVPSLLMKADGLIDRELYDAAGETLAEILEVNQLQQEAWALMAVLAHLRGDFKSEEEMRRTALSTWSKNPAVDHLIGKKLSQKYRFEEGAKYQRRAIEFDSGFIPARLQLAQDMLRLGQDEIGWELARSVANQDPYNVVAINLVNLNGRIQAFQVLERDGIQVKMDSREALIYGQQVLDLLSEAKSVLCEKYDVEPRAPVVVEIFPQQKDFAIRTFGLPGGAGFLGVCFGRVITANSPASQGENPSNWQSVLWHEFCHVVTLEKTKNRMPRWLSEGISVYEERQRDPSWGESMTPIYRKMLLGDELTPVSQLSGAFLNPPSPIHLQFAYYESSLVVEFLIEKHGIETLKRVLDDLGDGLGIEDALSKNVGPAERLDLEFAEYAVNVGESFGADANWSREEMPEKPSERELVEWVEANPNSYWGLRSLATAHFESKRFEEAKKVLEKLRDLGTFTGEAGGPQSMLAMVYRELGETDKEIETLERIIGGSSDSLPALRRLIELAKDKEQWERVSLYSEQILAINPLLTDGQLSLSVAADQLDRPQDVVRAMSALAELDPIDPAAIDYRMAKALAELDDRDQARVHVLRALEEAPRYRDAHRLLLELIEPGDKPDKQDTDKQDSGGPVTSDDTPTPADGADSQESTNASQPSTPNP